jgi:MFS family permease
VAAVANLNLSVANVALPSISSSFDSSQTMLDLIAVGPALGLAASALWFGALGDGYGRKMMIVLGMLLAVPASLVAGFAPSDTAHQGVRTSQVETDPGMLRRSYDPGSRRLNRVPLARTWPPTILTQTPRPYGFPNTRTTPRLTLA